MLYIGIGIYYIYLHFLDISMGIFCNNGDYLSVEIQGDPFAGFLICVGVWALVGQCFCGHVGVLTNGSNRSYSEQYGSRSEGKDSMCILFFHPN